ncbi:MAG: hypothetical protein WKF82_13745 [Nocardioidaceae bacterium]
MKTAGNSLNVMLRLVEDLSRASLTLTSRRLGHVEGTQKGAHQHRTAERDRLIADSLDAMLRLVDEHTETENLRREGHVEGT